MSNLANLMNSGVQIAEPEVFESMNDTDAANLLYVAMQDAAIEAATERLAAEDVADVMEGVSPEESVIIETSIIRLDKNAKKQRAYKLAILQCAKEDDNKDYKKLETIWKMEKFLFRRLEKKYAARARSRMHQTANKSKSKNALVKRAKGGLTRSQKETQKAMAGNNKIPTQLNSQFKSISAKVGNQMK